MLVDTLKLYLLQVLFKDFRQGKEKFFQINKLKINY